MSHITWVLYRLAIYSVGQLGGEHGTYCRNAVLFDRTVSLYGWRVHFYCTYSSTHCT